MTRTISRSKILHAAAEIAAAVTFVFDANGRDGVSSQLHAGLDLAKQLAELCDGDAEVFAVALKLAAATAKMDGDKVSACLEQSVVLAKQLIAKVDA